MCDFLHMFLLFVFFAIYLATRHREITMTRSDLVDALEAQFEHLPHRDADMVVKTILEAMAKALAQGHRIEIRGFGSFSTNYRPARVGRNPRTGESVQIPEKRVIHFKPGKGLREAVDSALAVQHKNNA